MKKLNYFLLLSAIALTTACSNNDDDTVVAGFEGKLTTANTAYQSTSQNKKNATDYYYYYDQFEDNAGLITFDSYYIEGTPRSLAGFFYTNSTDNKTTDSYAPICGKAKVSTTYLAAYSNDYTPAVMTINEPTEYTINGCWVANSTYAYNNMTIGDSYTTKFKSGSWYKITAIGYDKSGNKVASVEKYLANYTADTDTPEKDWVWFDLTQLKNAVSITFTPSSSDSGEWGMNTSANFCLDGITLDKK